MRHENSVVSAAFSPDGRCVVTASSDNTARIWESDTGKAIGGPLQHENRVVSAAFSPDGRRVLTASWDHTARLWDIFLPLKSRAETEALASLAELVAGRWVTESSAVEPIGDRESRVRALRQYLEADRRGNSLAHAIETFLSVQP